MSHHSRLALKLAREQTESRKKNKFQIAVSLYGDM
jgi:hypothetical protein